MAQVIVSLTNKFVTAATRQREHADAGDTNSREQTPIVLEYGEEPDQFVPKSKWAVVNVSGMGYLT